MQPSRRAVLAAVPVALAGCGRSLRDNTVPGGLDIRNRRGEPVTVSVRAALLPEPESGGDGAGITESPTATPETPRDADLEDPAASGEYRVPADGEHRVPDFFPRGGRWAFEAVVDAESGGDGDRTRIVLHAALPGPAGADTMLVTVRQRRVTVRATEID
jgi:hypothetical protein